MPSLWSWISCLCRQKRILLLLCTFGSSFLAFNYSLLSSSTTNPSSTNAFSTSKIDDVDNFNGDLSHGKHQELDNNNIQQHHGGHSLKPPIKVHVPALSLFSNNASEINSISLSSPHKEEKTPKTQFKKASSSLIYSVSQSHPAPPPVSKHAQKSFTLQQRKVANNQLVVMIDEHSRKQTNQNNIKEKEKNRVNFLQSVIGEKDYNSNSNNILTSSNLQEADNRISIGFHSSKHVRSSSNALSNAIDNNDNVKSDEKIRQPTVASFSSSSSTYPSEIIDASISVRKSSGKKTISSRSSDGSGGTFITDFPQILANSIQSSLFQPSRPGLFSPALTAVSQPSLEFSSSRPQQQLTSFYVPSSSATISSNNNSNHAFSSPLPISAVSKSNLLSPFDIPPCNTTFQLRRIQKRKKNLTVIENFIMGWRHVKCNETITYTTHGDYRYLDNLVPLVDRWNGPVSLAIYCPGDDLDESLRLISYLKLCTSPNIDKWVTFHLIYDSKFVKRPVTTSKHGDIPWLDTLYEQGKWKDCLQRPTFSKGNYTFRIQNGLLYPINIARNIARAAATTYFVLASDIELYPSINLIPGFMEMLGRLQKKKEAEENNYAKKNNKFTAAAAAVMAKIFFSGSEPETSSSSSSGSSTVGHINGNSNGFAGKELAEQKHNFFTSTKLQQNEMQQQHRSRHVFVLPVFEVKKDIVPCQVETKEQLASLLKHRAAVLFHHSICPQCHSFPKYDEWKMLYPRNSTEETLKDYRKYNCTNSNGATLPPSSSSVYMRIFHTGKRKHPFQLWEPIFIGSKEEPIYDERLSWEGLRDKMVSGYIMCALDYDFHILDSAFLVHKPGIRKVNHLVTKTVMSQDRLINYRIRSELLKKFGKHDECAL